MKDYAVKVSVRNGRILQRMRELGIVSQSELARRAGVNINTLCSLITLRKPPMRPNGEWYAGVRDIAAVLRCDPEELFSAAQQTMALQSNSTEVYMDEPEVRALASGDPEASTWAHIEAQRLLGVITNDRERMVVEARMEGASYDEIGGELGVTRERIRQLEKTAHRRMRTAALRSDRETARLRVATVPDMGA